MKPRKWPGLLAWLGLLVLCAPALAQEHAIEICDQEQMLLGGAAQVHVDEAANLTPPQVARLPPSEFAPLETRELPRYTKAAVWLKLTLRNGGSASCQRWLHLAKSNVEDQQVHVLQGDGFWRSQRAGNAYPPYEWASAQRLSVFTLALQPGETVQVLARVSSQRSVLVLNPQLYSDAAWLTAQQTIHLIDGLSQGILLLVVGVGFIAGWILRSGMLLALSVGAFFNGLFVCVANGYLYYVPALLPYTELCAAVTGLMAIGGFMIYVQQFYGLNRLPRPWSSVWTGMIGVLLGAYIVTRALGWYDLPVMSSIGLWVIGGFFAVLLHRQRHRAMAWAGAGLMALQLLSQYVFHLDKITPWSAGYSPELALLSSLVWQSAYVQDMSGLLTGAMWLAATLMLEVRASRRREQRAQTELETQRQGELERLEKTVAQRTSQLREALDARRHLLARISHDLRSPLAGIIDMARQPVLAMETAWRIEHSARRQLELIDELLEFSRHDLQGPNIASRPGYLYALLREMEDEAQALARRQGNRFESSIPTHLPIAVSADFYHLRQVLLNLLGNAAKFTQNGNIRLEVVKLGLSETSVQLRFTVADTGSGIPLAEREKIMRPFGRGANAEGVPGVGLGLSIVRQLLEGMGAELSLDAEPQSPEGKQEPQGSRFSFVLELALVHEEDVGQSFMESHATHVEGAGRRVLVADDLAMNRDELADLLGGYGFDVVTAPDGQAAWEKLRAEPFDLLLTDQMMPRLDGWQLLARVRTDAPDLPVMLYSASPPLPPMDWPAQTQFDASLLKPAASGELLQWVDRLTRPQRTPAQKQA